MFATIERSIVMLDMKRKYNTLMLALALVLLNKLPQTLNRTVLEKQQILVHAE